MTMTNFKEEYIQNMTDWFAWKNCDDWEFELDGNEIHFFYDYCNVVVDVNDTTVATINPNLQACLEAVDFVESGYKEESV